MRGKQADPHLQFPEHLAPYPAPPTPQPMPPTVPAGLVRKVRGWLQGLQVLFVPR